MAAGAGRRGPRRARVQGRGRGEVQAHRGAAACPADGAGRGPGGLGVDEDHGWTLARIAELVRRRFGADYTLAGMDLLLHRIGWSVRVAATEPDEARIAAWREETWPVVRGPRRTWTPGSSSKTNLARP